MLHRPGTDRKGDGWILGKALADAVFLGLILIWDWLVTKKATQARR